MTRLSRARLLLWSTLASLALVPVAHADLYAAACLMSITATFAPGLTDDDASSTMGIESSSEQCAGTGFFVDATVSGNSPSNTINCRAILVLNGSGTLTYDDADPASFSWLFVGNVEAGLLVLTIGNSIVVGAAVAANVDTGTAWAKASACLMGGAAITTVTFTAALAFVEEA